ncbi:hypothetical protein [Thalassolituus hydrocarboniclasticus]|uniref:HEAT repeat domain-containing protein n=1 Tax=Thalassolituus hydrocarboniclasticus TaxID=2742796 RepID=A0ABY6ACW7_9GAMM|nr:hypothetical protein [Thalassolituus hydrocarboniclasticus]UXD88289.1 hypothetical protein HUF19_13035 [Thalassolituus hydrocarboniclasticus]
MRWLLRISLSLLVLLVVAGAGFYLYLQTLPTRPPAFVGATDIDQHQAAEPLQCAAGQPLNAAYRVQVEVVSRLNNQLVYSSGLSFRTQLQQANGDLIRAVATDIRIDEGDGALALPDLPYLSRVESGQGAVFVAFNDLGLMKQHPLAVISQLLKGLSVGHEGETYRYAYDSLQRLYRYRQTAAGSERAVFRADTDLSLLSRDFAANRSDWRIVNDGGCLPQQLTSTERQALQVAGQQGYIEFRIRAEGIPLYADLNRYAFNEGANAAQRWQMRQVSSAEFATPVTSAADMWAVFAGFAQDRNTARLIRAAEYLLDNFSPYELADALQGNGVELSDEAGRDLIFALGISGRPEAEDFMLDVLQTLPQGAGEAVDMQKVRLMVALSASGQVTPRAYSALDSLARNAQESVNVQANALISMGSMVRQLERQGSDNSSQQQQLTQLLSERMDGPQAASAIMAANNAGLTDLDADIIAHLGSSSSRERYAAGMTLSRDPQHYPLLLEHLQGETSNLVSQAILANMDVSALSQAQRNQLNLIADNSADVDKAQLIQRFLTQ